MSDKSSGVVMGIIITILFGIIGTPILSVNFGGEGNFDLSGLYADMSLDSSYLNVKHTVTLLSFSLGGLVAGVRTKNGYKGFLSGFFGVFSVGLLALLLYVYSQPETLLQDVDLLLSSLTPFALGMIEIMLVASITGFSSGKMSQEHTKQMKSKI